MPGSSTNTDGATEQKYVKMRGKGNRGQQKETIKKVMSRPEEEKKKTTGGKQFTERDWNRKRMRADVAVLKQDWK